MTDYDKLSDKDLSILVAEKVMGWTQPQPTYHHWQVGNVYKERYTTTDCVDCGHVFETWNPAGNWDEAMQVRDHVRAEYAMSDRIEFNRILQRLVALKSGVFQLSPIEDWPDAWMLITPQYICIAALMVKDPEASE